MAYISTNPYTGQVIRSYTEHTDAEMEAALATSHALAKSEWATGPVALRTPILSRLAELLEERGEDLSRTMALEMGKPLAQSKSATALLSVAITRHWADRGIASNALNPGAIATRLQRHTGGLRTPVERRKTPEQGAATSVLLAASPLVDGIGGRYFEDCIEARSVTCRPTDFSGGFAAYALDGDNADRLWAISQILTRASAYSILP